MSAARGDASDDFRTRYGRWALVAGAGEGLGAEFARQLAERGLNLLLIDRDPELLGKTAAELRERGAELREIIVDLARPDLHHAIRGETAEVEVGLLVYNAAFTPVGPFLEQDLEQHLAAVDVNCRGPVVLVHELGRAMAGRGRGGIVLLSSLSGFRGSAGVGSYAASKAFNRVLAEALWDELRESGVDVVALCPGATRTPGYERSAPPRGFGGPPVMKVGPVVRTALDALGRGPSVVPGFVNRLGALLLQRLLPSRTAITFMGRTTRSLRREG